MRTRLTHSMEVQQVGRYIAKEILSRLKELKLLETYGLEELTGPFESIVEMSCLMHDIGNPPFGHFGEAAINDWFRQRLHPEDAESQPLTDDRCSVAALRLRTGKNRLTSCGAKYVRTYVILRECTRHSSGAYIDADESHLGTGWRYFKIYSSGVVAW